MIRKILRIVGKVLLGLVIFLFSYLIVMFVSSQITVNSTDEDPAQEIAIYIKSNGVHTDIVVPLKNETFDWSTKTKIEHTTAKDSLYKWVAVGWGDHDFYLNTPEWSDLKFSTAFNAAFFRGKSLLHVGFYRDLKQDSHCKKIMISNAEYQKLVGFINSSFDYDSVGNPMRIDQASYGKNDTFYKAVGKYNLFYTCNSWANNALRHSGQKAALWTLHDKGIFCHYK